MGGGLGSWVAWVAGRLVPGWSQLLARRIRTDLRCPVEPRLQLRMRWQWPPLSMHSMSAGPIPGTVALAKVPGGLSLNVWLAGTCPDS